MKRIAIIGMGYVGLPLAVELAKKNQVVGFDINPNRVAELNRGHDSTLEVDDSELAFVLQGKLDENQPGLLATFSQEEIAFSQIYIITVPTPIDKNNRPDLTPLVKASETVGRVLKMGDYVIYESTVYPGATEEECVPILERVSGLRFNTDFFVGYSPERINPGDKVNTLTTIKKVTSGSTPEAGKFVDDLYKEIIIAGTHLASSIKVAEAAKVIENAQRDINIAFVNELSKIFHRLDIDTLDVLEAAGTKWNFLHFKPGLVGGHCIGVDPFYLAQKAQEVGYHPEIILAGRRLNDSMGAYVAGEVVKLMLKKGIQVKGANVLILGITFKENCPDIRNTRVVDIYHELLSYSINVDVHDPWASPTEIEEEYGIKAAQTLNKNKQYDAVILAVAHKEFESLEIDGITKSPSVVYDVKGVLNRDQVDGRL
jgi:UDP-N-acetyl-D-galactosamine dehydrogenase